MPVRPYMPVNPETHCFVARAFKEQSPFTFFPVGKEFNPFTICTRAAMERLEAAGLLTTVPQAWKDYLFDRKLEVWQVKPKEFLEPEDGGWQSELMELWEGEFRQDDVEPTEKERRAEAKRLSGWYWTDNYDPQGPYATEAEARKAAEES
jgi:hypothetical protein